MKRKILIDLDVITVAEWEKRDARKQEAEKFLRRAESGEFYICFLEEALETVSEWSNAPLRSRILEKISEIKDEFADLTKVFAALETMTKKDPRAFLAEFVEYTKSQDNDLLLVITCSVLRLDYLVTLNRRHLRGRTDKIREFLEKHVLFVPEILFPEEVP